MMVVADAQAPGSGSDTDTLDVAARVQSAQRALDGLEVAVRDRADVRTLEDNMALREAVASATLDGSTVSLADLLLFEASTPLQPGRRLRLEHADDPGVVVASRHLAALNHGRRRWMTERALTKGLLVEILTRLSASRREATRECSGAGIDSPGFGNELESAGERGEGRFPEIVADGFAELEARLRSDAAESAVVRASATYHRLARLRLDWPACGALSRIGAMLVLAHSDRGAALISLSAGAASARGILGDNSRWAIGGGEWRPLERERRETASFADATGASAASSLSLIQRIALLVEADAGHIGALSLAAHSARRVHVALQRSPVIALPRLLEETGLRAQAATSALHRMRALGIVREITGRQRHRLYSYDAYIALLADGLG